MEPVRVFESSLEEVNTGELRVTARGVLRASALGSCIAVALYDARAGLAGLVHIMLPGLSPDDADPLATRYANNGICALVRQMLCKGASHREMIACAVGGGNVLRRPDDTICEANHEAVLQLLEELRIPLLASDLGGNERRSMSVSASSGRVHITVGDSAPRLLWQPFAFCSPPTVCEQAESSATSDASDAASDAPSPKDPDPNSS